MCNHCGWRNHDSKDCSYPAKNPSHPYINTDAKILWVNSDQGKAFIAKHPGKTRYEPEKKRQKKGMELSCTNHEFLPMNNPIILNTSDSEVEREILKHTYCANKNLLESKHIILVDKGLDVLSCICHDYSFSNNISYASNKTTNSCTKEEENNIIPNINNTIEGEEILSAFTSTTDYTIPANAITEFSELPIRFLLDIGSLQANYVSLDMAKALEAQGVRRSKCNHKVCSAMSGICKEAQGRIKFFVK